MEEAIEKMFAIQEFEAMSISSDVVSAQQKADLEVCVCVGWTRGHVENICSIDNVFFCECVCGSSLFRRGHLALPALEQHASQRAIRGVCVQGEHAHGKQRHGADCLPSAYVPAPRSNRRQA